MNGVQGSTTDPCLCEMLYVLRCPQPLSSCSHTWSFLTSPEKCIAIGTVWAFRNLPPNTNVLSEKTSSALLNKQSSMENKGTDKDILENNERFCLLPQRMGRFWDRRNRNINRKDIRPDLLSRRQFSPPGWVWCCSLCLLRPFTVSPDRTLP